MTDKGPRIFRTLEKTDGRDSFDAIVRAALESFAALARPSERQVREFGRLVLPLFDRTDAETRRILATSLASFPALPRELVERLVAEPTRVVAPFLAASPLLAEDDLRALAKRRDRATRTLLKTRGVEPDASPAAAPRRRRAKAAAKPAACDAAPAPAASARSRPSSARQTALLSTGTPDLPAAQAEEPAAPMPTTAAETRTLLRRLASTGRREPAPRSPAAPEADLLSLALGRDADRFHSLLAAKLLLDREQVALIETDASGRELAAALKALDTGKADAMTAIMMLKPAIGSDVAAFEALERIYETLDAGACRTRYPIGPGAFADTATHRPLHAETRPVIRPEARSAVFGRRASIPGETARKRRS